MKIGLLLYGSLDIVSGGYLYDRMLVELFRRKGDEVEVVALSWRNYARHLADNLSPGLRRRLEALKVDVLLEDELNHPSLAWTNSRIRPQVSFPILSIVHHLRISERRPAWQNSLYGIVERRYLQGLDGYVFNSQTTRHAVSQAIGQPESRLAQRSVVAYPAGNRLAPVIQDNEIEARAFRPGPLRILFLGNLIPRKGLHTLLSALELLAEESWELWVVGNPAVDARYTHAVRRQAARAGLAGQVRFTGLVDGASLAVIMKDCHLLAVPSSYEGFGIVYLEGMGFGLPAIAGEDGAAHEIITPGLDGFLVPPEDAASLAAALLRLIRDRQTLAAMGQAARRRYLAHPTWEQTGLAIREYLLQTLDTWRTSS